MPYLTERGGDLNFGAIAAEAVTEWGAMQKPSELEALLGLLAPLGLRSVLEIGGMYGGTMWCWAQVCAGPYVCVDLQVLDGRMESIEGLDYQLIVADSTDPETPRRLGDQKFDFIFVDGSHRYEAVCRDFENWAPLLTTQGIMAFHDICHRRMKDHDMWRFWQVARQRSVSYEIYDPAQGWGGIGVLANSSFGVGPSGRLLGLVGTLPAFCAPPGVLKKPPQCCDPCCECCGKVLDLERGEEALCVPCAAVPA